MISYPPIAPDEKRLPISDAMRINYDTAIAMMEKPNAILKSIELFILKTHFKKEMRKILLDQLRFIRNINKCIHQNELEKARKMTALLISSVLHTQFCEKIAALSPDATTDPSIAPATTPPTDTASTTPTPPEPFILRTNGDPAHDHISMSMKSDYKKYGTDVIAELRRLVHTHWMHEKQKSGKHRFSIGRTKLLILAELLKARSDTELTINQLTEALPLQESTIRYTVNDLQKTSLLRTCYAIHFNRDGDTVQLETQHIDTHHQEQQTEEPEWVLGV